MIFCSNRVEIIRLSDKSFKETIKDVDLSTYRSTTKEGYVSLDPSKPLPHEYEEGKLSRYSDNGRQKYGNNLSMEENDQQNDTVEDNELEAKFVSQYANATDSVILNKTEFREILMSALNNTSNNSTPIESEQLISVNTDEPMVPSNDDVATTTTTTTLSDDHQIPEISERASPEHISTTTSDEVVYLNETIEKLADTRNDDALKKTNSLSLDTPEVDKLLNEGNTIKPVKIHRIRRYNIILLQ